MGLFGGLFRGRSQVSQHGELMPAGDLAYPGLQVSLSPISLEKYRDMRRDPTVSSSMQVALTGMLPGVQVVAANEHDPRAMKGKAVAERALAAMRGSPLEMLHALADEGRTFGFTVAEPVWMLSPDGLWTLRALKAKRAESLRTALDCDEYGNLLGIRQTAPGAPDYIPAEDIVYWRHRGGWYEPYGQSALYEAFDAWQAKTIFVRAWAIYLSRHGQGILTWKVPDSQYRGEVSRIKDILQKLQTGTGLPLRSTDDLNLIESNGTPGTVYQQYYQTLDKAIVRAILYQELATSEGVRVGSFAASKTQADVMWSVLRLQGEAFCEAMREQVLAAILRRNGYGDLPVPMLLPEPIGAPPDPATLLQTLTGAVSAGVVPPLTPEQAQDVLARMGVSPAIQAADRSAGSITTKPAAIVQAAAPAHDHTHRLAGPSKYDLRREFDKAEDDAATEIDAVWRKIMPEVLSKIGTALWDTKTGAWKTRQPGAIRDAVTSAIRHRGQELRDTLTRSLEGRYEAGREFGKSVIAKHPRRGKAAAVVGTIEITPTQALDALRQGSFLALQKRYDVLAEDLYYEVYRTLRGDRTIRDAAAGVQSILSARGFTYDQALTLVRTEMTRAYNEGRMGVWSEFETADRDTDEPGLIIGYRFNAVLDNVTTEECEARNGHVFEPGEVDVPPLHFNCRSVLEPVYSDDPAEDLADLRWSTRNDMPTPGFQRKDR